MPTSTYKSPLRPPNAPVFFALTPQFPLIWTAVKDNMKKDDGMKHDDMSTGSMSKDAPKN